MSEFSYQESITQIIEDNKLDLTPITSKILEHINQNTSIWIIGNGGSASTAEHFETDLHFIRSKSITQFPKVAALTSNSSLISAISNDIGYENVFSIQLMRKAQSGDLCVLISASGNSENLINAVQAAKALGVYTIGILGFDGGQLSNIVDLPLLVKTKKGMYGPVEDIHLSICHEISARIYKSLTKKI
jgi:D-sedoheptulose 7-phosphate isomerase